MAFQMNATFGEVELEDDAPEQRGFRDGVVLRLGAMRRLFEREREREREKDQSTECTKNEIKRYICMIM